MSESDIGSYWKSVSGIAARISDIAHNFSWQSLAESVKGIFASESDAKTLVWRSTIDNHTCDLCYDLDGSTYTEDDAMLPDMPQHVICRCIWEIVSKIPTGEPETEPYPSTDLPLYSTTQLPPEPEIPLYTTRGFKKKGEVPAE